MEYCINVTHDMKCTLKVITKKVFYLPHSLAKQGDNVLGSVRPFSHGCVGM